MLRLILFLFTVKATLVFAGADAGHYPSNYAKSMEKKKYDEMQRGLHASQGRNLRRVVQEVIDYHPVIDSRRAQIKVNKHQVREARATYFPTIDLTLGTGVEWSNNATTRTRFGSNNRMLHLTRHESSLNLTQRVFDGFETSSRTKAAKKRYKNSKFALHSEGEDIGIRAVQVFIDVLRQRELVDISRKSVAIHESILEKIKQREKAGFDRGADVYQAQARLSLAKTRLENQKGALSDSISAFVEVVGNMPGKLLIPTFDDEQDALSVNEALDIAMKNHPAVRAAMAVTAANKAEIKLAKSPFYPALNVVLSGSENEDLSAVSGQDDTYSAAVEVNYNLFRGGADLARKRRAVAAHSQAVAEEGEIRRQLRENIRRSFSSINLAKAQVREEQAHLAASEELVKAYEEQFKIGTRRLLAVLDAEDERTGAESNLKNNQFRLLFEQHRLMSNVGRLLQFLNVNMKHRG